MSEYEIFNEDCLEGMKRIETGSVDMILTDLPYGTTDCAFDVRIPFEPMWEQFKRVTKRNAAIALFSQMPFGAELIMSNKKMFRYKWCWLKTVPAGFLNSKKMPMRIHEDILIFYQQLPVYNPQKWQSTPYKNKEPSGEVDRQCYGAHDRYHTENPTGERMPNDVLKFSNQHTLWGKKQTHHPTQKPTDLLEYLIRTYTNEGELVLDATMGSGSTGVAAINTGRRFIGFETEQKFFDIAQKRIDEAIAQRERSLFKLSG